jgi:hypothetical protein
MLSIAFDIFEVIGEHLLFGSAAQRAVQDGRWWPYLDDRSL